MKTFQLTDGDEYMKVADLAAFLGFKVNSIYVLINNGSLKDLPRYKFGKIVLFKRSEVEEFIKNSRVKK